MPRDSEKKDSRGWALRLEDMVSAVRNILEDTDGLHLEEFSKDRRRIDAVLHNFTVLGEAARHVPSEVEVAHPDVPWSEMRIMRNIAVHVYHGIKLPRLWDTAHNSLPPLLPQLESLLAKLDQPKTDEAAS